ncbi:hypothetical protein V4F39_13945 [Aquincola sp. MAHUQ-54]|uniref:Uncharacterized protein n=1 Tax=Aquincola agrisoli TaxID=3119538 RepID=A0AAW9QHZ3_9BURK
MKITLPSLPPRNPFATAARRRRAGVHRPGTGAVRQQARRELRRDLDSLRPPSP